MCKQSNYPSHLRKHWRKQILSKGQGVSNRLSDLLAGKNVLIESLPMQNNKMGKTPEERLRQYLELLMDTLKRVDNPEFGRCEECDSFISEYELNEMPWASICRTCQGRALS